MASGVGRGNSMIRVGTGILVLVLLTGFAVAYTAKFDARRELNIALRGIEDKVTLMIEALQP
jgi:hypothetical protein